jgi:beta-lactam-binding protein with PASTA domain
MLKFITHRSLWLNILAGAFLGVAILFVFLYSLKWITHHDESKTVPSVAGKTFEEAEQILEAAGFEVEIQDSIYVDTAKPLKVIKQVPEADEVVKVNRTVYLTINRAVPPLVEMPNLVGFSFRSAEMELLNMGLRVGDTLYESNYAKDAVLKQLHKGEPIAPGTKIRMGSVISFVLGTGVGTERFIVPQLVGMRFCDAKALIESHGLVMGVVIAQGVEDTCNAYINRQIPERYTEDKKFQYIRTGQTIDVFLQTEKPVSDSSAVILPDNN